MLAGWVDSRLEAHGRQGTTDGKSAPRLVAIDVRHKRSVMEEGSGRKALQSLTSPRILHAGGGIRSAATDRLRVATLRLALVVFRSGHGQPEAANLPQQSETQFQRVPLHRRAARGEVDPQGAPPLVGRSRPPGAPSPRTLTPDPASPIFEARDKAVRRARPEKAFSGLAGTPTIR